MCQSFSSGPKVQEERGGAWPRRLAGGAWRRSPRGLRESQTSHKGATRLGWPMTGPFRAERVQSEVASPGDYYSMC